MKKLIQSFIMCFMLLLVTIALTGMKVKAETSSGSCGENVTYTLDTDSRVLTIRGVGAMYDYADYNFGESTNPSPFSSLEKPITTVIIESGVTGIGSHVFDSCRLESITIPDSVTSIGDGAFEESYYLKSVSIPGHVTSIGDRAFYGCGGLATISVPDSVTSIGVDAFRLTAYYNDAENWDKQVLYIGNALIQVKSYNAITGDYTVKAGTKVIADKAFYGCSLTGIEFPDSVSSIGAAAFSDCFFFKRVTIGKNVTRIGKDAFDKEVEISGYKGSAAESYAAANQLKFVALDKAEPTKKPTTTKKPTSTKKPTVTKKPTATTKPTTTSKKEVIKGKAPKVSVKVSKRGKSKYLSIKYKYKASSKAVGFQVRYKKGNEQWTVRTFYTKRTGTRMIAGLKKGKYSVQVRSYTKNRKTYSKWSKTKKVTVK